MAEEIKFTITCQETLPGAHYPIEARLVGAPHVARGSGETVKEAIADLFRVEQVAKRLTSFEGVILAIKSEQQALHE